MPSRPDTRPAGADTTPPRRPLAVRAGAWQRSPLRTGRCTREGTGARRYRVGVGLAQRRPQGRREEKRAHPGGVA
jgi:hypothetical protein